MSATLADRRRFEIQHCLGAGGFGEVYLATMISAGGVRSEVALKMLHSGLDPRGQAVERLRDEARLLGMYNHPSILRVHDLVLLDGRVTLVTEYVDGADLDRCTEGDNPLPLAATLAVIGQIADALNTAYNREGADGVPLRLLHRDIKPANIRIGRHGEVKLLDFGIATAAGFNREAKTQANAIIGSFPYMAPERFERTGDTTASDVYSLGCVLFEALTQDRLYGDWEVRDFFSNALSQEKHDLHIAERLATLTDTHPAVFRLLQALLNYHPAERPSVETLGMRCEDLAAEVGGTRLSRWCRGRRWHTDVTDEGVLSGRIITEASFTQVHRPSSLTPPAVLNPLSNAAPPSKTPPTPRMATAVKRSPEDTPSPPAETVRPAPVRILPTPRFFIAAAAIAIGAAGALSVAVFAGTLVLSARDDNTNVYLDSVTAEASQTPAEAHNVSLSAPATAAMIAPKGIVGPSGAETEPTAVLSTPDCAHTAAMQAAAKGGGLTADHQSCLHTGMRDSEQKLTERGKSGRILLVDLRARCDHSGSCAAFETEQRYYFEEIGRSDVDMLYLWTMYLYQKGDGSDDTLTWVDRTLERKAAWRGVDYIKRVDQMLEVGARVSYQQFSQDDHNESLRKAARNRSIEWLNYRIQLGKPTTDALALCASAAGSSEVCQARMHDETAETTIVLVSVPVGAAVTVDGVRVGDAPIAVPLSHGAHVVGMVGPKGKDEQEITVGVDTATRWTWRSREDRWESSF